MTDYLTEQEQVEILKNWIKQYSLFIIAGIVIGLVAVTGWRYWQQRQAKIISQASSIYDEMVMGRNQNDSNATVVHAQKLFTLYPRTVYSQMAAFMLARSAVVKKDYPAAEKHLHWVINHSSIPSFRQIARLRLARLMIAENKPQEGINILNKIEDKSFNGLIDEIKGDAYLAMKNISMARQSYKDALTKLPNAESIRPLLQIKYENLTTIS